MKHTPLPWFIAKPKLAGPKAENDRLIHTTEGKHIAEVFQYQSHQDQDGPAEANAEFIIRACNSYYDLVEVCKEIFNAFEHFERIEGCNQQEQDALDKLRQTLVKLEGKSTP